MEPVVREPLDGSHASPVGLHREQQAGAHRLAVEQHGAGAAHAVLAAEVRSRQLDVLAEEVRERLARLDEPLDGLAVDGEADHVALSHGWSDSTPW